MNQLFHEKLDNLENITPLPLKFFDKIRLTPGRVSGMEPLWGHTACSTAVSVWGNEGG